MKKKIKNKYIITTLLSICIYLIYLKMMEIYPFGKNSIIKCDLYQQYINFFCYLKEIILNGKSIFISWNMGLANNFYTTFAYYLISPFNLFVIFFNSSNMDIFVELITLIKIVLMANFMVLFLEKSYNYKNNEAIIFGLIYAYSSFTICYSFHIMWLDALYMLPIVLLFVDKYLITERILPFALSLSFTILTNYYMGYIIAFFSGIYYLIRYFIIYDEVKKKNIIKNIAKFLVGIITSFAIGMIVILPSILQLKGKMNANIELLKIDFDKIKLFINVIFNNYVYSFTQKSCFIFSSTLVTLLLPMYYLNKNIKAREKIGFTAIILFLLLPIISPFLNKLWHAFTTPNCFNYRYSFTLIFTLVLMASREFQNKEYNSRWHFIVSFIIFTILTLIEIVFMNKGYLQSDGYLVSINSIIISYIIYLIMIILIYIIFNKPKIINSSDNPNSYKINNITSILLCIVIIIDLIVGAKSGQNNNDKYFKREVVTQYDEFMNFFLSKLKNPEIERIVFEPDEYRKQYVSKIWI